MPKWLKKAAPEGATAWLPMLSQRKGAPEKAAVWIYVPRVAARLRREWKGIERHELQQAGGPGDCFHSGWMRKQHAIP
jgi:hypothetical protein